MKYIENEIIELKSTLTEDTKTEIVAFLNSYLGGTIYIGVDNTGNIVNLTQKEKDLVESKIINWIRDEAIYPNCSEFIKLYYNDDNVLSISINPGNKKPYYLKDKGPKPSGVYVRYGRNKSQASQEEITRMIISSKQEYYEEQDSSNQNLTFNTLKLKFEEKNLDYNKFKMITSGFIKNNRFTNLAYIFSDQYDIETKIGIYIGLDRSTFKSKKEFNGSIIKQIDKTIEYCDLCNETRIVIDGSPTRKEYISYHSKALREAILNCYCHRDYYKRSNIKIEFFENRCEIISPGGFFDGLTLEEALCGVQSFRNKYLVQLLHKLGYIENYSSGLNRIVNEYQKNNYQPKIETSLNMFKITLPNLNYNFNEIIIDGFDIPNNVPNVGGDVPNHDTVDTNHNTNKPIHDTKNDTVDTKLDTNEPNCDTKNDTVDTKLDTNEPNCDTKNNSVDTKLDTNEPNRDTKNHADDDIDIEFKIILAIEENNKISQEEISKLINKSLSTIKRIMRNNKNIIRIGSKRSGYWKIIDNKKE